MGKPAESTEATPGAAYSAQVVLTRPQRVGVVLGLVLVAAVAVGWPMPVLQTVVALVTLGLFVIEPKAISQVQEVIAQALEEPDKRDLRSRQAD